MGKRAGFYAVRSGRNTGVYTSWSDCESEVKGFRGAIYKKFSTLSDAIDFVKTPGGYNTTPAHVKEDCKSIGILLCDSTISSALHENPHVPPQEKKKKRRKERSADLYADDKTVPLTGHCAQILPHTPKRKKTVSRNPLIVYADGSALNNGRADAMAGIGVYFGFEDSRNISRPLLADEPQTNQRAELQAAIAALDTLSDFDGEVEIRTDSRYVINGVHDWLQKWKHQTDFKTTAGTDVAHRDLWEKLDSAVAYRGSTLTWAYVPGHSGEPGNTAADALARAGACKR